MFSAFLFCNLTNIYCFLDGRQNWGTKERAREGDDKGRQRSGLETQSRAQVRFFFFSFYFINIYYLHTTRHAATVCYHCTPPPPSPPRQSHRRRPHDASKWVPHHLKKTSTLANVGQRRPTYKYYKRGARDVSRLEPQVCFLFYFIHTNILPLLPTLPLKANVGPRQPTKAHEGQHRPTVTNSQCRPTTANDGRYPDPMHPHIPGNACTITRTRVSYIFYPWKETYDLLYVLLLFFFYIFCYYFSCNIYLCGKKKYRLLNI